MPDLMPIQRNIGHLFWPKHDSGFPKFTLFKEGKLKIIKIAILKMFKVRLFASFRTNSRLEHQLDKILRSSFKISGSYAVGKF